MLPELIHTHEDDAPHEGPVDNPMIARHLMIELAVNEQKAAGLRDTLRAVALEYDSRIAKLEERQVAIREMLTNYVEANGKVSFPDVGTASLTTRKARPKLTDADAAMAWAKQNAPELIETVETLPAGAVKEYVEREGVLPNGVELIPESKSLTIRGLS
jgi:hypothetical protein